MSERLPVVAAIPNYNMADSLKNLLPSMLEQGYDDVVVLDDASTDHSRDVVSEFGNDVAWVGVVTNRGAGAARNHVLSYLDDRHNSAETAIHFVDADIELASDTIPEQVADFCENPYVAFTGGLVTDTDGLQMPYNYGPRPSLKNDLSAYVQWRIHEVVGPTDPERAQAMQARYKDLLSVWPNPYETPERREVYWTSEANLMVNSKTLRALGGFDPRIRERDIIDVAHRAANLGMTALFDPAVKVIHTAGEVRNYNRDLRKFREDAYMMRKHGFMKWLAPSLFA